MKKLFVFVTAATMLAACSNLNSKSRGQTAENNTSADSISGVDSMNNTNPEGSRTGNDSGNFRTGTDSTGTNRGTDTDNSGNGGSTINNNPNNSGTGTGTTNPNSGTNSPNGTINNDNTTK